MAMEQKRANTRGQKRTGSKKVKTRNCFSRRKDNDGKNQETSILAVHDKRDYPKSTYCHKRHQARDVRRRSIRRKSRLGANVRLASRKFTRGSERYATTSASREMPRRGRLESSEFGSRSTSEMGNASVQRKTKNSLTSTKSSMRSCSAHPNCSQYEDQDCVESYVRGPGRFPSGSKKDSYAIDSDPSPMDEPPYLQRRQQRPGGRRAYKRRLCPQEVTSSKQQRLELGGRTALHLAIELGYHEIVEILVEAGADVNALDEFGRSPLQLAGEQTNMAIAKTLLSGGAVSTDGAPFLLMNS